MTRAATARFNQLATNFATSEVHSSSVTMERLHRLLGEIAGQDVLDVGCGAGHLALSFVIRGAHVVALDGAPSMLAKLREVASARAVDVELVQGMSGELPFESGSFDIAVSRLAAHHFPSLSESLAEMARVLRPGGQVAVIDLQGDENALVDAFNHELEMLHDPTHVRSYRPSIWRRALEDAGLVLEILESNCRESISGVTVQRWCEIAASGNAAERAINDRLRSICQSVLQALGITCDTDGHNRIPVRTLLVMARKPCRTAKYQHQMTC